VPNLALAALQKQVKAGTLAPVHVFVGEDTRLMDRLVDAVEATVDPADRPFAVERFYAGDERATPIEIAAAARVMPMLGDRRIVFVLRAERLLKPKRASKAAERSDDDDDGQDGAAAVSAEAPEFGPLEDYLASPVASTSLVFVARDMDKSRRFTKRLQERAQVTRFDGLAADSPAAKRDARSTAAAWVQEELTRAGRTIEPAAVQLLVERAGGNITRLRADIERVMLYTEGQDRIGRADVAETVSSDVVVDDEWAVVNAISAGDAGRALREVGLRMDRGDSPHAMVGQLRWWVSAKLADGDPRRVKPAIEALLRTDLALKSSGGDPRVLIERLVVELTGRPLPQQRGWRR
jgi:DNA polymerase-3 subunit delta